MQKRRPLPLVRVCYPTVCLCGVVQPANILLAAGGSPKITDFGVSRSLVETMSRRNTAAGTTLFMAPEVAVHSLKQAGVLFDAYTVTADIWSLGVTL